jgi:hypothetical protein
MLISDSRAPSDRQVCERGESPQSGAEEASVAPEAVARKEPMKAVGIEAPASMGLAPTRG